MKTKFYVLFILILVVSLLTGCIDIPEPTPSPTITPTPTTLPYPQEEVWYGWWNKPFDEWPTEVDGLDVCYIRLAEDTALYRDADNVRGEPILPVFSQVPDFGDGILQQRTVAKEGKWLMVYARGTIFSNYEFIENDSQTCRAFRGDGGRHVYLVMEEQIVDGRELWVHPHLPLYMRVSKINAEFVPVP